MHQHVALCSICSQIRGSAAGEQPMLDGPIPVERWSTIEIDLLKLPKSYYGSQYLLVVVDIFSKYSVLVPLKDKTAESVAQTFIDSVFCTFNAPRPLYQIMGAN